MTADAFHATALSLLAEICESLRRIADALEVEETEPEPVAVSYPRQESTAIGHPKQGR